MCFFNSLSYAAKKIIILAINYIKATKLAGIIYTIDDGIFFSVETAWELFFFVIIWEQQPDGLFFCSDLLLPRTKPSSKIIFIWREKTTTKTVSISSFFFFYMGLAYNFILSGYNVRITYVRWEKKDMFLIIIYCELNEPYASNGL